ncbi:hypothetical protein [Actinoplanes sp. NPDC089786]|uniref:hypothetical protein n=1 Tax=Actinoplanes sp. NPDC089786 TaxID=3155185 RepID=UPI00342E3645
MGGVVRASAGGAGADVRGGGRALADAVFDEESQRLVADLAAALRPGDEARLGSDLRDG